MQTSQNNLGLLYENDAVLVCFGQRAATKETFKQTYPHFHFLSIRQTHSDICIPATDVASATEADAHFTGQMHRALLISTADCIPLMVYCKQTHRIAAVHAGWRGVENKLTIKTLEKLIQSGSTNKNFIFFFGPHIGSESFEVDEDVCVRLQKSSYDLAPDDFIQLRNNKYFLNLQRIVASQITSVCGKYAEIHSSGIDTKTDLNFFSYRRERQTGERNLSWIVLKTPR